MTLVAAVPWDETVVDLMRRMEKPAHCELSWCEQCGWPYYRHSKYQDAKCVACSEVFHSWDKERHNSRQKVYARKRRVKARQQKAVLIDIPANMPQPQG